MLMGTSILLAIIGLYLTLILPGLVVLWKAILFGTYPDVAVIAITSAMFFIGSVGICVLADLWSRESK